MSQEEAERLAMPPPKTPNLQLSARNQKGELWKRKKEGRKSRREKQAGERQPLSGLLMGTQHNL